jgi:hypothetical protein
MSENKFYTLVAKKEQLLALLNTGFIDDGAWVRFVYEAEQAGCEAMAENMSQRFIHYKKLQQLEESND